METDGIVSTGHVTDINPFVTEWMSTRKRRLDEYEIVDKLGSLSNKRTRLEQVPEEGVKEKKKQLASILGSIEDYALFTDPLNTLHRDLCEFALHEYNATQNAYSCFTLKQDEFYENVNVVQSLRIHSAVKNTSTYFISFEASLPADNTTQTFITKISLSFPDPILSSAKMDFHYVKIKGEENDYEEEEEGKEEDNLSDYADDPESEVEDPPQENLPKFHKKDSQENLSGFSDGVHSKDSIESYSESDGKHSKNSEDSLFKFAKEQSEDSGESLSKSDEKYSKDSGESPPKSDEKHSKDFQENLSETIERYSKASGENISKFCDGEPSKASGENLSKFDNEKHSKDSKENLSEFDAKDTKTRVRYYCHTDLHFKSLKRNYKGSELSKEIESFSSDVDKSDGFEVGYYPLMDAAGIHGTWIFKYYDRETAPLDPIDMNYLVCLSRLAICVYNMKENTYFGNVRVLKAMTHGVPGVRYNITFEATLPDNTTVIFQTRIFTNLPLPYAKIEIVFVRVKPN